MNTFGVKLIVHMLFLLCLGGTLAFKSINNFLQGEDKSISDKNQEFFPYSSQKKVSIQFPKQFSKAPQVLITLDKVSWKAGVNIDFMVSPIEITTSGFTLRYQVNIDQANFHCQTRWQAFDDDSAFVFYKQIDEPSMLSLPSPTQLSQDFILPLTGLSANEGAKPQAALFLNGFFSEGSNNQARVQISSLDSNQLIIKLTTSDSTVLRAIRLAIIISLSNQCACGASDLIQSTQNTLQVQFSPFVNQGLVPMYGLTSINGQLSNAADIIVTGSPVANEAATMDFNVQSNMGIAVSVAVCTKELVPGGSSDDGNSGIIIVAIIVPIVVVIIIIAIIWKYKKNKKQQQENNENKYKMDAQESQKTGNELVSKNAKDEKDITPKHKINQDQYNQNDYEVNDENIEDEEKAYKTNAYVSVSTNKNNKESNNLNNK